MFVSKEYKKLGIGQGLLDVTLDFARRAGYFKILLYISSDLKAARNLYLKNSFEDMKRYNDDYRADAVYAKTFVIIKDTIMFKISEVSLGSEGRDYI